MSTERPFKHSTPIQIRFVDQDSLGHVNNANYLSYIELARIDYLQDVLKIDFSSPESVILAKATVDYKLPILLNDKIEVLTRYSRLGNKSFDIEYQLVRMDADGGQTIMATAHTVIVAFNYVEQKPIAIPQHWKEKLEAYDGTL